MANRGRVMEQVRYKLYELIWLSTAIEGLNLLYATVVGILDNRPVDAKPSDILFVMNMKNAWDFMLDALDCDNDLPMLRQLNRVCGTDLICGCGELRKQEVRITGYDYIPIVPQYFDVIEDLESLSKIQDPISKACAYFCYVVRQQLFIDGNIRVAQLIANKILLESGVGYLNLYRGYIGGLKDNLTKYYATGKAAGMFAFLRSCVVAVED